MRVEHRWGSHGLPLPRAAMQSPPAHFLSHGISTDNTGRVRSSKSALNYRYSTGMSIYRGESWYGMRLTLLSRDLETRDSADPIHAALL